MHFEFLLDCFWQVVRHVPFCRHDIRARLSDSTPVEQILIQKDLVELSGLESNESELLFLLDCADHEIDVTIGLLVFDFVSGHDNFVETSMYDLTSKLLEMHEKLHETFLHQFVDHSVQLRVVHFSLS
jgi:hypothetical protein